MKLKIKLNKKMVILLVLIFVAVGGYTTVTSKKTVYVQKVEVLNKTVKRTVSSSGIVKSEKYAEMAFPITGKITSINVEKGEEVKKGYLLAKLYDVAQVKNVQAAKDTRDIALRNKEIYIEQNQGTDRSSNDYKLQIRKYDEFISQAESNYQSALASLKNYYLTAPFDGVIIDITKKTGEIAPVNSPVIKIADLSGIYFEIQLDQEDFGYIKKGQSASIKLDAYPNIVFDAKVVELPQYISTELNGNNSAIVKLQITTLDDQHPILLNMTGDAMITVMKTKKPVEAISFDQVNTSEGGERYLWELVDGKLKKLPVETGIEGDTLTEIKTDLSGKTIVNRATTKEGNVNLVDGAKAKIIQN